MAQAGPHARLESAAASDHAGGRASGAPASPAGTSRPASPRLACSGGPEATFGPDGPDQQREHRDDRSARQPQGRDDRRRAPNQRPRLDAKRVRDAHTSNLPPHLYGEEATPDPSSLLPSSSTPFAHNPHIRSRTCSRLVLARFSPVPPPATLTGQASPSRPTRPSISRTMIPKVLARLLMPTLRSSPRFCPYPSTI